jgi:replicative DNA helicase
LPSDFNNQQYGTIYQAIIGLNADNSLIDIVTVSEALEKQTGRDWIASLTHLTSNAIGFGLEHVKEYAEGIKRKTTERKAQLIASDLIKQIAEDGLGAVDGAITALMDLSRSKKQTTLTMRECLLQLNEYVEQRYEKKSCMGVTTGISDIDKYLGGFHNSDLIVIGARPAMGKTALLINMALKADVPCAIFSTEQGGMQVAMRSVSIMSNLNAQALRNADLDNNNGWETYTAGVATLMDRKIYIDEDSAPTIADIQRQARKWKHQHNIQAVYVDYIQRIRATNAKAPKHERVEEVVMGLKSLSRELNVPVVALAQVNRSVESRPDKRPSMGDLKDSGSIEQEADQIMMLYRDEVYTENSKDQGIAEINIEKNRHGPIGCVRVAWIAHSMQFRDLTYGQTY